jgi:hypothetical protein
MHRRDILHAAVAVPAARAAPSAEGGAIARVRRFLAPLRYGVNVERGEVLWKGWLTDAALRQYASHGVTHVRISPPSGGQFPIMSQDQFALWLDASRRIINAGMTVFLDCLDVVDEGFMARGDVPGYIRACARSIAARNFNPGKIAVGAAGEYAGGTNRGFEARREECADILHAALPNHVIVTNGAYWGAPETMMDGTLRVDPGKPRLHQWHLYDWNAGSPEAARYWQERIQQWADANRTVTYCSEWGIGPPDNSNGVATNYGPFPDHIRHAARGMGQQRPTQWAVTGGRWWRLNEGNSATLRPEIAAAISEGSRFIASQRWYKDQNGL